MQGDEEGMIRLRVDRLRYDVLLDAVAVWRWDCAPKVRNKKNIRAQRIGKIREIWRVVVGVDPYVANT